MALMTMEKPQKPRAKKESNPIIKELENYTLAWPVIDFCKEGNENLKRMRVDEISLNMLLLWLGRHIVRDHPKNSKWFGGSRQAEDYIFWFKMESDKDRAEGFLKEIKDRGTPIPRTF